MNRFVLPLLRGCGQMLFQPSALTGWVFLALILTQSPAAFVLCLAGAAGATLCAYTVEHPEPAYFRGEGGFNGGLLGLALWAFFEPGGVLLLAALAGGALTGLVRVALKRLLPVPPYTAPFIIVTWAAFLGLGGLLGMNAPEIPPATGPRLEVLAANAAQVLFLTDPWAGVVVLAAVLLHSLAAMLWLCSASLLVWLAGLLLDLPAGLAASGLLGYNALILAAALQHRGTRRLSAAAGIVLSVWLSYLFIDAGVTPLSAPFVLSAWLVIALEAVLDRRRRPEAGR